MGHPVHSDPKSTAPGVIYFDALELRKYLGQRFAHCAGDILRKFVPMMFGIINEVSWTTNLKLVEFGIAIKLAPFNI